MAEPRIESDVAMPADRLLHARLGHSAKVSSLSDLEFRVWTTYVLATDDFGVMRADAVAFQAAHDALSTRSAEEIAKCVERLVETGLVAAFEHQGARYLYQWDWQDFQRVRFPARTLHPLPDSAEVSGRTHHLWSVHPGGARVPGLPKDSSSASTQLRKLFRRTSGEPARDSEGAAASLPQNFGSSAAPPSGPRGTGPDPLPENSGTTSEVVQNNSSTTSAELPSHARACETANGLWLREEGGAGGEGRRRQAKASLRGRGGGARSTERREAYDAGIRRAKG